MVKELLSVPSVVFAEEEAGPSWYGSLRGGLQVGGGVDAQFFDGFSRWGIRGSSEVSDGLTAVYQFEHAITTTDAGQPNGRLAYVGLSGGFGSLSLGQIWSASFNHVGAITDKSSYFGAHGTSGRHGSAVSYAFSSGAVGFQLDLVSDGGQATGKGIDKTEFGVTVGLGEIGRVALAHTNQRDQFQTVTMMPTMQDWINTFEPNTPTTVGEEGMPNTPYAPGTDGTPVMYTVDVGTTQEPNVVPVERIMVRVASNYANLNEEKTMFVDADDTDSDNISAHLNGGSGIARAAGRVYTLGTCDADDDEDPTDADACITVPAYSRTVSTTTSAAGTADLTTTTPTETFFADATTIPATDGDDPTTGVANTPTTVGEVGTAAGFGDPPVPTTDTVTTPGFKRTHVAVEFSVGGITPYLGYSKNKANGATQETKTTHYGLSGGLGDTGMSYLVAGRSVKAATGGKTSPWLVNVSKGLGGGATVIFEHGNDDDGNSGRSRVGLHVNF